MITLLMLVVVLCAGVEGTRYTFYRSMGPSGGPVRTSGGGGERRVFGGSPSPLQAYPATCALLDRYWSVRCSGAALASSWVLTAAHCVSPQVAYVKYNSRRPSTAEGDVAPVQYLYRHPGYKVLRESEEGGVDVTLLHHDIGLVRTRYPLHLATPVLTDPLKALRLYNPIDLKNEEVQVLGFGRTEHSPLGEELFTVRLRAAACERGAWLHCVCGVALGGAAGAAGGSGVCSGDSGGPVVFRGAQVALVSMGPVECAQARAPPAAASSVFTALHPYAELVRTTINDTDSALAMRRLNAAPHDPHPRLYMTPLISLMSRFVDHLFFTF